MKGMYKKLLVRVLSVAMIVATICTNMSMSVFAEGANERSKNWIALGASKSTISSLGNTEFTYDELRILGVFLSNFYVPWSTQINNTNDSKANDATKENMKLALTDSLNFNNGVAESLVATVFGMSETSAQKLYIESALGSATCSYANLMMVIYDTSNKGSDYRVYWKDDAGNECTVFAGQSGNSEGSSYIFGLIMSQLNISNGYGTAFLGTSADFESQSKLSNDTASAWRAPYENGKELLPVTALGQQMYVDCFGNILCDTGAGRAFVVVPACLNSYTFIKDGKEPGDALPVNNLFCISLNNKGLLIDKSRGMSLDEITLKEFKTRSNKRAYRIGRGSTAWDFDTEFWSGGGEGGSILTDACDAYNSADCEFKLTNGLDLKVGNEMRLFLNHNNVPTMSGKTCSVIQDWILFDSIGGFSEEYSDTMYANKFGIFGENWGTLSKQLSSSFSTGQDKDNAFNVLTDENSKSYLAGIFASLVYAYFRSDGVDSSGTEINDKVAYKINLTGLPSGGDGSFSMTLSDSQLDNMLKSFMYYVLHPSEGTVYIKQLFGKLTSSFLLKAHEDIVGNTSANNTTGGSRYLGFPGYVTVPNLTDLSWTNWILQRYESFFIYFVLFMLLIIIGYVFLGSITLQKGIMYIIIFACCSYLPPTLINSTVNLSNKVCDSIYGDKFTYWALVQHQFYVKKIDAALSTSGSHNNFLLTQFENEVENSSQNSTAVALKWLAPKKDNYLSKFKEELKEASGSSNLSAILGGMLEKQVSGETYLGGSNDMYLYRSYTDLGTYASTPYSWLRGNGLTSVSPSKILTGIETDSGIDLGNELSDSNYLGGRNKEYSLQYAMDNGFNYKTQGNSYDLAYNYRIMSPLASTTVSKAIKNGLSNVTLSDTDRVGIVASAFNKGILEMNNNSIDDNQVGTFIFGEYTESPFYYLSFNLNDQLNYARDNGLVDDTDEYSYKNLFLQGDGDYFYNNSKSMSGQMGYGELRDFMDMRSFFYGVIPYLKEANDVVIQWDKEYGLWLYDGIDADGSSTTLPTTDKDSELYYKWWHNKLVTQLYNLYSPWVDKMYECDYAKPTKITVHGERFNVSDPLDPYSYYEADSSGAIIAGRYMVFSESEMGYYGLSQADLTPVEKKIIDLNRNSYSNLLELMDYYTFDDEVINTAAAMIETFNFNRTFSQSGFLREDYTLYPQSYELKNFTYDAYLRLILVNATGEDLQSTSKNGQSVNLYQTILENTSFVTGILMIGLDCIATYVIPALKLFFLLMIFVLSLVVLTAAIINIELNIVDVMSNALVKPLIQFFLVSVGMAFAVSLFMSNGNTAVTGRGRNSISLGDPTMTIIVMVVINIIVVVLYWKICVKTFKNCKKYAHAVFESIGGMATGAFGKAVSLAGFGAFLPGRALKKTVGFVSNTRNRGLENKANRATIAGRGGSGAGSIAGVEGKKVSSPKKSASEKATEKANRYNQMIQNGYNRMNERKKDMDTRQKLAETYDKMANDKSQRVDTRLCASMLGKKAKVSAAVHNQFNVTRENMSNTKIGKASNNRMQRKSERLTNKASYLADIDTYKKSLIGKSKK